MRVDEYQTRYETILKLKLPADEKKQMLLRLLGDIERAPEMLIPENEAFQQEVKGLDELYLEVFSKLLL